MIAFNRQLLENTLLLDDAKALEQAKFISREQYSEAKKAFPALKTSSNLFFRIAFLVLGAFCYSSFAGFVALIVANALNDFWIFTLFMAIVGVVCAELFSRNNFYAHGLDDAAILGFQIFLGSTAEMITNEPLAVYLILTASGTFCALRYLNTISALLAIGSLVAAICYVIIDLHLIQELYLTVVLFVLGIVLFVLHRKAKQNRSARFYRYPLVALEVSACLIGYFSMNYLIVRELAQELIQIQVGPGNDIPLAFLFYFMTFAIPIALLYFGIAKRKRVLLWTGLFTMVFSILSMRVYYYILDPEWELLLGGIALGTIALLLIRKLKHRETGLTFEKDRMHNSEAFAVAQAVIVNSHSLGEAPSHGNMEFGGGGFSGGGAGESF